jgi:hypothetical protein
LFVASHIFEDVAKDAACELVIRSSASVHHVTAIMVKVGGDAFGELYEGVTVTDNDWGDAVTVSDESRLHDKESTMTITETPTVDSAGSLLHKTYFPGGAGVFASGAAAFQDGVWGLCPSTAYLVRVTNKSDAATHICVDVSWQEFMG